MSAAVATLSRRSALVSLVLLVSLSSSPLLLRAQEENGQQCATTCHEVACDQMSIRYGKYCGVGHGGCPDEPPCDAVDACCKRHDDCVTKGGVLGTAANKCHTKFIKCLEKNMHKGDGFSKTCPYSTVIPNMKQGIQLAMMFSSFAQPKQEL